MQNITEVFKKGMYFRTRIGDTMYSLHIDDAFNNLYTLSLAAAVTTRDAGYIKLLMKHMHESGWNQKELAKQLKVTEPTITRWKKGVHPIPINKLYALGINPDEKGRA